MSRIKKVGKFFTVYLDRKIFEKLKALAETKGQTRTMALERILKRFFDNPENVKNENYKK